MERKATFNPYINGFRGLCIFFVFIYHIYNSGIIPEIKDPSQILSFFGDLLNSFKYGVEMFFMISGYVIMSSLKRHDTYQGFLLDRAIRIYPTWIPLHLLSFTVGPFLGRDLFAEYNPGYWILCFFMALFFLPPIIPVPLVHPAAWSLSYEWCFYIVAGITILYSKKLPDQRLGYLLGFAVALLLINLFPRGLFFFSGILVYLYEDTLRKYIGLFKFPLISLLIFLLAWLGTGAEAAHMDVRMIEWLSDSRILYALMAFVVGTYMFACVTLGQGLLSRMLLDRLMQFFGNISYAFYLWSPAVMMPIKLVSNHFVTPFVGAWAGLIFFTVCSFIASTIISWLNYVWIEKHLTGVIKEKLQLRRQKSYVS